MKRMRIRSSLPVGFTREEVEFLQTVLLARFVQDRHWTKAQNIIQGLVPKLKILAGEDPVMFRREGLTIMPREQSGE